jgi:hypothetical protein
MIQPSTGRWLHRLRVYRGQVGLGLGLFVAGFPVLWRNEARAVRTHASLEEGAGAVVSVAADHVEPAHDGRLVHVAGLATTTATVKDPRFGISAVALKLVRRAEMYQWVQHREDRKQDDTTGAEVKQTIYTYEKVWSAELEDSSLFKQRDDHRNPSVMPVTSEVWHARPVTLGAFVLGDALVDRITREDRIVVAPEALAKTPGANVTVAGGLIYLGADPTAPEIGDVRLTYTKVPPVDVTVVAAQRGTSFGPYPTRDGAIELLQVGRVPPAVLFAGAAGEDAGVTWAVRLLGLVLMAVGAALVLRPLLVAADALPVVGDILDLGLTPAVVSVAIPAGLATLAGAWLLHRPSLALALLAVGGGVFALLRAVARRRIARAGGRGEVEG